MGVTSEYPIPLFVLLFALLFQLLLLEFGEFLQAACHARHASRFCWVGLSLLVAFLQFLQEFGVVGGFAQVPHHQDGDDTRDEVVVVEA